VADGVAQRRWTADELAVALDRSLSCAQAGERLGHTRVQVEKAQKRSRAVELERVAQADIARYGEWTPGDPGYRPKLDRNGDGVACEG
jgi:Excalibur calcium-binding domain